jgi:hypothetical protein
MFEGAHPKFVWNDKHKRWDAIPADDSRLARWAASFSLAGWSRLLREHHALPYLSLAEKLTEEKLEELARLAQIKYVPQFRSTIQGLILDAYKSDANRHGSSAEITGTSLEKVIIKAEELKSALSEVDVGAPAEYPGMLLELQLELAHFKRQSVLIPDLMELTDLLISAASKAKPRESKRGRRPAAGGNFAFDDFVRGLFKAPWLYGGIWRVSKSKTVYKGNFLSALEILRPFLPDQFYPKGNLGRSVDHILNKSRLRRLLPKRHHNKLG